MTAQSKNPNVPTTMNKKVNSWDLAEAIRLRIKNKLSYSELSQYFGMPESTIHKKIHTLIRLVDNPELNEAYEANRATLLTATERILVSHLVDEDKLKAASINNIAYAFQQVTTARRLEEGLSTQNISNNIRNLTEERKSELGNIIETMYQSRIAGHLNQEKASENE